MVLQMVAAPLSVKWFGPYNFVENQDDNVFTCSMSQSKGVYLFTIPYEGKFLIYYVGETSNSLANRLLQHIQNYLSGFYRVFEPEEFVKGRKVLVWGGMWKPDRKEAQLISEFLKRQSELSPKIVKFVEQFRIFLAPIMEDARIIERIESEIARSVGLQSGVVGDFQDKDVRYRPTRPDEQKFKVILTFAQPIMGLNKQLLV
jgi:hypothetical protein